jgi:ABC-type multidrug transport system fused ATPase/permease subunit
MTLSGIRWNLFQLGRHVQALKEFDKLEAKKTQIVEPEREYQVEYRRIQKDAKGGMEIEFRSVWFKYPGESKWALKDVSFKIEAGETVCL